MRVYAKPLYLFEREVAIYNDLQIHGPADAEAIHERIVELDQTEIAQILKDLLGRGVVMRKRHQGRSVFKIKQDVAEFKILKRPTG